MKMSFFTNILMASLGGGLICSFLLISCDRNQRLKKHYPLKIGDKGWDTIYQTLPNFELTNQENRTVTKQSADSLLRVIQFFVPDCGDSCRASFEGMERIQAEFKDDDDVQLLSFALSPVQDSLTIIQNLAQAYQANTDKWNILISDEARSKTIAEGIFHLFITEDSSLYTGMSFKPTLYLIDREGRIRGKYDPRESEELDRLIREVPILKEEYIPKTHWISRLF